MDCVNYHQLECRVKKGESLQEFAADIEKLACLLYASAFTDLRHHLAAQAFVDYLQDSDIEDASTLDAANKVSHGTVPLRGVCYANRTDEVIVLKEDISSVRVLGLLQNGSLVTGLSMRDAARHGGPGVAWKEAVRKLKQADGMYISCVTIRMDFFGSNVSPRRTRLVPACTMKTVERP
ncbi:hypothetical protein J6590_063545 [Homalodisca vitripennis]|nr:hypothetical protein J6590_063545 [Homalodisca vitripennis]